MKKWLVRFLLALIIVFLAGQAVLVASPALRTRAYFAFVRSWKAHWHFAWGSQFPEGLARVVRPTASIWYEPEPHVRMLLDPYDLLPRTILSTGRWEPAVARAIQRHLPADGTLIDVGADIGYHSLKAATLLGPAGHVIAIEPNPTSLRLLRENIRASGATAIRVEPVACSNAEGTVELFAAGESNTGESSLSRDNASGAGKIAGSYRVPARTLDAIVKETALSRVDVIKLDVEGAEMLVLQGAPETLARNRPALVVEVIESQLRAMGTSSAAIREYLHAAGYSSGRAIDASNVEFLPQGR